MANEEHLKIIEQGVDVWNQWREENPAIRPDLSKADLGDMDLSKINLEWTDLTLASLIDSYLRGAWMRAAGLRAADLSRAILTGAILAGADLGVANLTEADLSGASLVAANLSRVRLSGANLTEAKIGLTSFGDVNLSLARGLGTVIHKGPSYIDSRTIYRSKGNIPEIFLQKAGVPDSMIKFMHSLVRSETTIDFYSCFISYSSKDRAFADRLYTDLQAKGVRCWFAPEDMTIGDKIRPTLDQSIRYHDKLLITLSEYSIESDWVEQEVETALARERKEKRTVLFPIRLDDVVMEIDVGWPALIRNTRHIGDFCNWRNHDAYQRAFRRLLRDLKAVND